MSILYDILEPGTGHPEWGYNAWLQPYMARASQTFQGAMAQRYPSYMSEYQGLIGRDIMEDRIPSLGWVEFLSGKNPMSEYGALPYWQQGVSSRSPIFRMVR